MKTLGSLLLIILLSSSVCQSQSKKELKQKVDQLISDKQAIMNELISVKTQMFDLKQELASVKSENEKLRSQMLAQPNQNSPNELMSAPTKTQTTTPNVDGGRCQAITAKGTQCSRNADPGSQYCWQHKSTYEPNKKSSGISSGSSSSSGRTIYTGPRGGKYYINSHGNKTYIKR